MSQAMIPGGSKFKAVKRTVAAGSGDAAVNSVLLSIPILRPLAAKIGLCELRRRLTHISPVCLPFLLWFIPHPDPWGPILIDSVLAIAAAIVGLGLYRFQAIARSGEEHGVAAIVGYAVPIVVTLLLLPGRAELGMMTLAIVAVGDGSATLGGLCLGGIPLPWNRRKTLTGLACFCICGTLMATVVYWGEAHPGVSWETAFFCAAISTLAAAAVESLPLPWNDNLRVGSTAALVGAFVQIVWMGR